MEESTRERDDEYVPPAIILDSELDYDEFDPEEVNSNIYCSLLHGFQSINLKRLV